LKAYVARDFGRVDGEQKVCRLYAVLLPVLPSGKVRPNMF
jgi:hypothetical protein